VVLIDQHGKPRHFYRDLVKDKVVLINAIYTSCAATCPIQSTIFKHVQMTLGDRVGQDVQMISVTLDPVTDTPAKLNEFAERFKAKKGWVFLTGSKQNVTTVLRAMDLYAANPEDHTPIAAVGHEASGIWMKLINLTSPLDIVHRVEHVQSLGEERLRAESAGSSGSAKSGKSAKSTPDDGAGT